MAVPGPPVALASHGRSHRKQTIANSACSDVTLWRYGSEPAFRTPSLPPHFAAPLP